MFIWLLMALVGASVIPMSPAQAAAGESAGDERIVVPLVVATEDITMCNDVGAYTLETLPKSGFTMIQAERGGETLEVVLEGARFTLYPGSDKRATVAVIYETEKVQRVRFAEQAPPQPFVFLGVGEGSELRVRVYWDTSALSVSVAGASRVCFRKFEGGWTYLCGRGQVKCPDGTVIQLGDKRTVDSCLDLLSSPDAILREGGARDLGRLTGDADVVRVAPRLAALLNDTVPFVRRGAAEGLGLIGRQECAVWLKAAAATEQEELTKEYVAEALALCGGNVLIGDPNAPDLSVSEAAQLYSEGRTGWADDMLSQRIQARAPVAAQTLISRLDSADADERLVAVQLFGAAKCVEAREALTKLSTDDPDEKVKAAAKEAVDNLPK